MASSINKKIRDKAGNPHGRHRGIPAPTTIACLIPAYNEAGTIAGTLEALLSQTRVPDIVVVIANGCTDNTAELARQFPVQVLELPKLEHRKSEALNIGWQQYARGYDIVISADADTTFPATAVEQWEEELAASPSLAGSTSKFTVQNGGFFGRLQKAEYAHNIQQSLDRGSTNVLAGAGTAFRGSALLEVANREDRVGPWSYDSAVEDYELTYRLRELGYRTIVSPTVRAYTDGMRNMRSLWGQRMKWQTGTLLDLLRFGWNPLTRRDWLGQALAIVNVSLRLLWVAVVVLALSLGGLTFAWWGWAIPLLYVVVNVRTALRVPHRDKYDTLLALAVLPIEFLQCMQGAWILASWAEVARKKITKKERDLWAAQYAAEGV